MAEELKPTRSSAKRKVNNLIRKLTAALREQNASQLKEKLEEEFDNLCDIDMQISEIEETDSTYLNDVSSSYDNVLKIYHDSLIEDVQIKNQITAAEKKRNIDRDFANIDEITERLKKNLSVEPIKLSKNQKIEIEEDKLILTTKIEGLLNKVSSLGKLIDVADLEPKVNTLISISNKIIRDTNVSLKLNKLELGESMDGASQMEDSSSTFLAKENVPVTSIESLDTHDQSQSSLFPTSHAPLPSSIFNTSEQSHVMTPFDPRYIAASLPCNGILPRLTVSRYIAASYRVPVYCRILPCPSILPYLTVSRYIAVSYRAPVYCRILPCPGILPYLTV